MNDAGRHWMDWRRGQLVRRHHLQAFQRQLRAGIAAARDADREHPWGLLAPCEVAVGAGRVVIRNLAAVLPDGTDVFAQEVAGDFPEGARDWVGVAPGGWESVTAEVTADDSAEVRPVRQRRRAVRLEYGPAAPLPVARLLSDGTADPKFLPPVRHLSAAPAFRETVLRPVLDDCRQVVAALRKELGAAGFRIESPAPWLVSAYLRAAAVARHLAPLSAALDSRTAPPLAAHQALAALADELATLYPDDPSTDRPLYDHQDGGAALAALANGCRTRLGWARAGRFRSYPFAEGPFGLAVQFPRTQPAGERFCLAVEPVTPPTAVRLYPLSYENPGAGATPVGVAPATAAVAALLAAANRTVLDIDTASPLWPRAVAEGGLLLPRPVNPIIRAACLYLIPTGGPA